MFSHYLHCYENLQYLLYTKMDDEIIKTSHENITHLAANTLYFLQGHSMSIHLEVEEPCPVGACYLMHMIIAPRWLLASIVTVTLTWDYPSLAGVLPGTSFSEVY